jgi:hypothetical protein
VQGRLEALLFVGVLAAVAIMPTQHALVLGGPKGAHVCPADIAVALLLGLWLLVRLATRSLRSAVWPPLPVVAFLAVALVSAARLTEANQLKEAFKELGQSLLYFGAAYMLFVNLLTDERRLRKAMYAFFVSGSAVVLFGLYQCLTARPEALFGVGSTFDNRHTYGAYLAILLPLAFGLLLHAQRRWERVWLAAMLVLGMVTVLYGATVVALVIGFAAAALVGPRGESERPPVGPLAQAALAAGVLFVLTVTLPANRAASVVDFLTLTESGWIRGTEDSGEWVAGAPRQRYIEWLAALNVVGEQPALGVGPGNYQLEIGSYYFGTLPNLKSIQPDSYSLYLVTAATTGLLGLACLVAILLHFAAQARGAVRRWPLSSLYGGLARGAWGAMCAAVWHNMFSSYLVRGVGLVFIFLLALIAVLSAQNIVSAANVNDDDPAAS